MVSRTVCRGTETLTPPESNLGRLQTGLVDYLKEKRSGLELLSEAARGNDSRKLREGAALISRNNARVGELSELVKAAFDTGREVGLDPLLLLSVMAIESGFNPYAESGVGAQGLMQVMSKVHSDKFQYFGGESAALE